MIVEMQGPFLELRIKELSLLIKLIADAKEVNEELGEQSPFEIEDLSAVLQELYVEIYPKTAKRMGKIQTNRIVLQVIELYQNGELR